MSQILLLIVLGFVTIIECKLVCTSQVYCEGDLLKMVQLAHIFKDSKTFVDMSMAYAPEVVLKNFQLLQMKTRGNPTKNDVIDFVHKNFRAFQEELEEWQPADFKSNPKFLMKIANRDVRRLAQDLTLIWAKLGRKIRQKVHTNPIKFSIIPVPNGFIVPGGRFREYYYWDSYWIIKGLLICEMTDTARGMMENFFHVIDKFGFVPNGGRIYYQDRSQPPMLTLTVNDYIGATQDFVWLKNNLKYLETEMRFWLDYKTVEIYKDGEVHILARYKSLLDSPRPESYREDFLTASHLNCEDEKRRLYLNLRTSAETGWDFSSRWICDDFGGNKGNLSFTKPTHIIPVDLNAILCKSFRILHTFYNKFLDKTRSKFWLEKAENWEKSIHVVLYNKIEGIWFDYDYVNKRSRRHFYPSNFAPLWLELYNPEDGDFHGKNAAAYLTKLGMMKNLGGIPASLYETGEQWDYPNGWPPCQSIVVFGLEKTKNEDAKEIAKIFAHRWIYSILAEHDHTGEFFEKYNAFYSGIYGTGGEYEVQTGFGWTNGGLLELIDYYYVKRKSLQ